MKKVTFDIPKNYTVPEGIQDGQEFDENVTLKLEGDKLCVVAINGVPLPAYEKEKEGGSKAKESNLASRYSAAMMQPQPDAS